MKTKEQTCKFNINRKYSHIVEAYCIFGKDIKLPPHKYITESIAPVNCKICKCYEKANI